MTRSLRAYAALTRVYTALPLALLSYGIGIAVGVPAPSAAAVALAIASALAGGYAWNDLRDQAADRVNRPARPLVAGVVTQVECTRLIVLLFGAAVILAATAGSVVTLGFVACLIVSSLAYSDYVKPIPGLKNAFVGIWSGLLPWSAALDRVPLEIMLPGVIVVGLFVTQKELVADVYDREGDAAAGTTTLAVLFGPRAGLGIVAALNLALLFVALSAGGAPLVENLFLAGIAVASVNALSISAVLFTMSRVTVRAYLELQKAFQIGGCIVLFAVIVA